MLNSKIKKRKFIILYFKKIIKNIKKIEIKIFYLFIILNNNKGKIN